MAAKVETLLYHIFERINYGPTNRHHELSHEVPSLFEQYHGAYRSQQQSSSSPTQLSLFVNTIPSAALARCFILDI
ncbi:hypothetical protein NPIL_676061 [Nephila pilipes]|uniref:Uncharacterized protein n=1 Tax=Nephila pilipes TaxID=299642 RepID=A0A8X6QM85_NEPPI|nr:hypothetical protein NPIL_676061 [Nephila pilipes]